MDKLLDELNNIISADQEMLSLLPKNNKKDIDEYLKKISEVKLKYRRIRKQIANEIQKRYHRIIRKKLDPEVIKIKEAIEKYDELFLLNDETTSFEKMGLDIICYNLCHFYKSDLTLINKDILKCIKSFEQCEIKLDAKDFMYNQYTYKYMETFFKEINNDIINSEKIKDTFESIYWKRSEIIQDIKLNIRYLYFKNQKEIDKYFKIKRIKIVADLRTKPKEIIEQYQNLKEEYFVKYNKDESVILNKFVYQDFDINKYFYNEIKNEYSKVIKIDIEKMSKQDLENLNDNIFKLSNTLYEYKNYLKYSLIIDDMKKRNTANSKNVYTTAKDLSKIQSEERKLLKLNIKMFKSNSKPIGLFNSVNKIEKLNTKINMILTTIKEMYDKFEEALLNEQIVKMFLENATVYQLLSYAATHYGYFCKYITKNKTEEEEQEINKEEKFEELKEFLANPQFNFLLKNIKINENKKIEQIIKDRYSLFNIEIQEDDLKAENVDALKETTDKIVMYNNIKDSSLTVEDIKFMCELKRITQK